MPSAETEWEKLWSGPVQLHGSQGTVSRMWCLDNYNRAGPLCSLGKGQSMMCVCVTLCQSVWFFFFFLSQQKSFSLLFLFLFIYLLCPASKLYFLRRLWGRKGVGMLLSQAVFILHLATSITFCATYEYISRETAYKFKPVSPYLNHYCVSPTLSYKHFYLQIERHANQLFEHTITLMPGAN